MSAPSKRNPLSVASNHMHGSELMNLLYLQPQAVSTLQEYDNDYCLFRTIEKNGIEYPAIGIVDPYDKQQGWKLSKKSSKKGQVCCPKDVVPIGYYIMNPVPVFEEGMDWFLLEVDESIEPKNN